MKIGRCYEFEAAHWIPTFPDGHKCKTPHGHGYQVEVEIEGEMSERGFVMDFAELDEAFEPVIASLDHTTLNNLVALDVPTVEVIATYLLGRFRETVSQVSAVKVWENSRSWALAK